MNFTLVNIILSMVKFLAFLWANILILVHSIYKHSGMIATDFQMVQSKQKGILVESNCWKYILTILCLFYYSWNSSAVSKFFKKKKSWEVLLGLVVVFTYIEMGKSGGWRGWVWSRGEQHFLLDKFQRPCNIQMLGDETGRKDFEPLSIKALIL